MIGRGRTTISTAAAANEWVTMTGAKGGGGAGAGAWTRSGTASGRSGGRGSGTGAGRGGRVRNMETTADQRLLNVGLAARTARGRGRGRKGRRGGSRRTCTPIAAGDSLKVAGMVEGRTSWIGMVSRVLLDYEGDLTSLPIVDDSKERPAPSPFGLRHRKLRPVQSMCSKRSIILASC